MAENPEKEAAKAAKEAEKEAAKAAKEAEKEAAKAAKEAEKEAAKVALPADEFIVGNPQELRPTELPLVIKPTNGAWANDAQAEYAKVLNAYAYKNPAKWNQKKDDTTVIVGGVTKVIPGLLSQLSEIGKDANAINKLRGDVSTVSFKNKLMEN